MPFRPDYRHIVDAACNRKPARLPLYEHLISTSVMEKITGVRFAHLYQNDKDAYFRNYCNFFRDMGYDTVSFECCVGAALPGSGALGGHIKGVIQTREDFERYPWDSVEANYFDRFSADFEALRRNMPDGMRAVGGVGNGMFESVQELVGYMDLCYMQADDPELYADMFKRVGDITLNIWRRFLREFGDIYCVCRFGDDLGYKSNTLLSADDIRSHVILQYRRIISEIHCAGKPFLLHSCGCIFNVMEDLIAAGIDAKHSNEDQIAPFPEWVERYGDRIGNFGGIDTDAVCRLSKPDMGKYIGNVIEKCQGHGGFAFGSGNSIPDYVPVDQYVHMVNCVRRIRGDNI